MLKGQDLKFIDQEWRARELCWRNAVKSPLERAHEAFERLGQVINRQRTLLPIAYR